MVCTRWCSDVFKVWWDMKWSFCSEFCPESSSERSLKIELIFRKVIDVSRVSCVFTHSVFNCRCCRYKPLMVRNIGIFRHHLMNANFCLFPKILSLSLFLLLLLTRCVVKYSPDVAASFGCRLRKTHSVFWQCVMELIFFAVRIVRDWLIKPCAGDQSQCIL